MKLRISLEIDFTSESLIENSEQDYQILEGIINNIPKPVNNSLFHIAIQKIEDGKIIPALKKDIESEKEILQTIRTFLQAQKFFFYVVKKNAKKSKLELIQKAS